MPVTPNFAIPFPCMGVPLTLADFSAYAFGVEAAIVAVDAEAGLVTHVPYAMAVVTSAPAFGVETIMAMSDTSSSGVTVGANTFTPLTSGLYVFGVQIAGASSSLTITSQRVAVYVNGTFQAACKWRGNNPVDASSQAGSYSVDLPVTAADVVTFRYLWTGTGVLGMINGIASMTLLSTP